MAQSTSQRAAQWQELINAEIRKDAQCSYSQAWERAAETEEGAALLAAMKRSGSGIVARDPKKVVQLGRVAPSANTPPGTGKTTMNSGGRKGNDAYAEGFAGGAQVNAMRAAGWQPGQP